MQRPPLPPPAHPAPTATAGALQRAIAFIEGLENDADQAGVAVLLADLRAATVNQLPAVANAWGGVHMPSGPLFTITTAHSCEKFERNWAAGLLALPYGEIEAATLYSAFVQHHAVYFPDLDTPHAVAFVKLFTSACEEAGRPLACKPVKTPTGVVRMWIEAEGPKSRAKFAQRSERLPASGTATESSPQACEMHLAQEGRAVHGPADAADRQSPQKPGPFARLVRRALGLSFLDQPWQSPVDSEPRRLRGTAKGGAV